MPNNAPSQLAPILDRGRRAYAEFASSLVEIAGITAQEAAMVTGFYVKHRLAKVDFGIGRISVRHGGLLDADVIRRAAIKVQSTTRLIRDENGDMRIAIVRPDGSESIVAVAYARKGEDGSTAWNVDNVKEGGAAVAQGLSRKAAQYRLERIAEEEA